MLQQRSCNACLDSERSLLRMYARQRLPGTCGWIFNHASYRAWLSPNGPACLWIHGLPGAGKTVLTSSALEELEKLETPAFAVISCFIDEVPGQGYSLQSLLALLSCKLSKYRRQPAPESNLSCIHEGYYHGRPSMSFADVKRHLGTLLANIDPNIQITLLLMDLIMRNGSKAYSSTKLFRQILTGTGRDISNVVFPVELHSLLRHGLIRSSM